MDNEAAQILVAFAVLQVKHLVFDFLVQRPYQFLNKGVYGHPGGVLHAGLHAFGSIPAILILPPSFWVASAIIIGEFLLHYHIDWTKERIDKRLKLTPADAGYYYVFGTDQLAHQLTYIGIIAILIAVA